MSQYLNEKCRIKNRKEICDIIDDFVEGKIEKHFVRCFLDENSYVNAENIYAWNKAYNKAGDLDKITAEEECERSLKTAYSSMKSGIMKHVRNVPHLSVILEKLSTACPSLDVIDESFVTNNKHREYLYKMCKQLNWDNLIRETYKELELYGDCFYQICYDSKSKKHYLHKLNSKYMTKISYENNEPVFYEYTIQDEFIYDELGNEIKSDKEYIYRFFKGYHLVFESSDMSKYKRIDNDELTKDMINIIHVGSMDKLNNSEFHTIPAKRYIDSILNIIKIATDRRCANHTQGWKKTYLVNLEVDFLRSQFDMAGLIILKPHSDIRDENQNFQFNVKGDEINNNLSSIKEELYDEVDILYSLAGLIPPSTEKRMSTSDSSKVVAQFREPQESKNRVYLNNINNSFSKFFKVILKENFKTVPKEVLFKIPEMCIKLNIFDAYLLKQQQLALGTSTLNDLLSKEGMTQEQVANHFKQVSEEKELMSNKEMKTRLPENGTMIRNK